MSWMEDTVTFRGAIRRSGNSLAITIPIKLSQRFLLREGRELLIYGLSRKNPDFERVSQVYLGYFVVHEKAPALILRVEAKAKGRKRLQEIIERLREKNLPLRIDLRKLSESEVEIALIFSALTPEPIQRVRELREVEDAAAELESNLSTQGGSRFLRRGYRVEERGSRESLESTYKVSEVVRWRWKL